MANLKHGIHLGLMSLALLSALGFLTPAHATHLSGQTVVTFDQPWYFIGHGASISISAPSCAPNDSSRESISVRVSSPPGSTSNGLDLIFVETSTDSGIFTLDPQAYVNFVSTGTVPSTLSLNVVAGSTARAAVTSAECVGSADTGLFANPAWGTFPTFNANRQPLTSIMNCATGQDQDGDRLCDSWETNAGLTISFGTSPNSATFTYQCNAGAPQNVPPNIAEGATIDNVCPNPYKKDIYVEVDWLTGHHPDPNAINDVINAFYNSPTTNPINPATGQSVNGINLHILFNEIVNYHNPTVTTPFNGYSTLQPSEFDNIKKAQFGTSTERNPTIFPPGVTSQDTFVKNLLTAKRHAFHYSLFTHFGSPTNQGASGAGEQPGNDFQISLGSFPGGVGNRNEQGGSFMHELGHNLNLYHGGARPPTGVTDEQDNCKPNYLSVMSWSRQTSDWIPSRLLDYSRGSLTPLTEGQLIENPSNLPASNPPNQEVVYGVTDAGGAVTRQYAWTGAASVNWDGDLNPAETVAQQINVNRLGTAVGCNDATSLRTLNDNNDWINGGLGTGLEFNMKGTTSWNDGAPGAIAGAADAYEEDGESIGVPPTLSLQRAEEPHEEIPIVYLRDVRSIRVNDLDRDIQNLPDSAFAVDPGAYQARIILHAALSEVNHLVLSDGLYTAVHKLNDVRSRMDNNYYDDLITDLQAQKQILEKLDSVIQSLKIALHPADSTDLQLPPKVDGTKDKDDGKDENGKCADLSPLKRYLICNIPLSDEECSKLPPGLQVKYCEIPPEEVECKLNYQLMLRKDSSPVCISYDSVARVSAKFQHLGWVAVGP